MSDWCIVRLGRIASPDGVAFVSIELEDNADSDTDDIHGVAKEIAEHPFGTPTFTGRQWSLQQVRFLAPILASKIVAIGKNYIGHAEEMGSAPPVEPVIFIKPNTAIIGPGAAIKLPPSSHRVDYEGELAIVIGRPCKHVPLDQAKDVILGYTIANDVTARDQQQTDGQWTRAKSYDTFCPLGPWIETELDPSALELETTLDGVLKQRTNTAHMIHTVPEIIAWVTQIMTLLPGDVILTGTPEGIGPIVENQQVAVTISGIGTLKNPVVLGN